jgi:peptidyl-prolyl cis-trans isomerase SurA
MNTCYRLTLLAIAALAAFLPVASANELDHIVAVINDDVIVRSELDRDIITILAQVRARGTPLPPQEIIERKVLDGMIDKRLQLQAAERLGVKVDDATLTRAVENIAKRNNLTLTQLRNTLEAEGISFESFREDTRNQIVLAKLRAQEVVNRITVTEREIKSFLDRNQAAIAGRDAVRLQHMLVAVPEGASPERIGEAREKIQRVLAELRAGGDFAALALRYSDGRQALEGGDLGWMKLAEVPTIAVEPARTLAPGEVSEPIRSASGFHLFRVAEVKGGERQLITQTHARHILIKTSEVTSDQDARNRLEQLRLRLTGGEDFAAIARAHSDDTASAIKGGDLGWVSPGDTVGAFEEQMDNLAPGELGQPFRTQFGWHLLQVLERRQHDSTSELLASKARDALRERKAEEEAELWLRRLRDEAYVEIRLDRPAP